MKKYILVYLCEPIGNIEYHIHKCKCDENNIHTTFPHTRLTNNQFEEYTK